MSLLQMNMFNNQMDSFRPGHLRSRSYAELLNSLKQSSGSKSESATNAVSHTRESSYTKKRSYSDLMKETPSLKEALLLYSKRSRTAPPSPPSPPLSEERLKKSSSISDQARRDIKVRARSLSPNKRFSTTKSPSTSSKTSPFTSPSKPSDQESSDRFTTSVKLPSITTALNSAPITSSAPIKLKPIMPTVSLDYFDTYKPNDENWRYGLLDTINKGSKNFNLNQYNYLNKHASKSQTLGSGLKPSFDSRISSKIAKPTLIPKIHQHERKINFPYESNYTYLDKTYMNDVARYPEYLELAHSLIQLSQPHPASPTNLSHGRMDDHSYSLGVPMSSTVGASQFSQPPRTAHYNGMLSPNTATATANPNYNSIDTNSHHTRIVSPKSESPRRHSYTTPKSQTKTKFIPISPPSSKSKAKMNTIRSVHKSTSAARVCISCGSDQSPCWRPSWSIKQGQLCNSCGLRYKKTSARCLNDECRKIPAKGEWSLMQSKGKTSFADGHEGYSCLSCNGRVEVNK